MFRFGKKKKKGNLKGTLTVENKTIPVDGPCEVTEDGSNVKLEGNFAVKTTIPPAAKKVEPPKKMVEARHGGYFSENYTQKLKEIGF
jgi:hypothetical protein